jgi:hypothetical protein
VDCYRQANIPLTLTGKKIMEIPAGAFAEFYNHLKEPSPFLITRMCENSGISREQAEIALRAVVETVEKECLFDFPLKTCKNCLCEPYMDGMDALYPMNRERTRWHAGCPCCHENSVEGDSPEDAQRKWNEAN